MRPCASTLEAEMTPEEHAFLLRLLEAERLPGPHLEIGTAAGGTLAAMMRCFGDADRPPFVVVDRMTYFPDQLETVRRNLQEHGLRADDVDFRVATSAAALREATRRRERFDFMLIDASHKILSVTADLRWTRLLSPGGILCLHDYCQRFPGVVRPVDRFLARHGNYARLGRAGSLLAVRKLCASMRREVGPLDRAHSLLWYLPLEVRRKLEKRQARRQPAA